MKAKGKIVLNIIQFFGLVQSCTFPLYMDGNWSDSKFDDVQFYGGTVMYLPGYSISRVGTTTNMTCYLNEGNVYILRTTDTIGATINEDPDDYFFYICMEITQITSYSFYYYLQSELDLNNERTVAVLGSTTLNGLSTICTTTISLHLHHIMVKNGFESEALQTCSTPLLRSFSFELTTSTSICPSKKTGYWDYTDSSQTKLNISYTSNLNCEVNIGNSATSNFGCLMCIKSDDTYITSIVNLDETIDNPFYYKFTCMMSETDGENVTLTQRARLCHADQTTDLPITSDTVVAAVYLTPYGDTVPAEANCFPRTSETSSAESSKSLAWIAAVVVIILLLIAAVIGFIYWWKRVKRKSKVSIRDSSRRRRFKFDIRTALMAGMGSTHQRQKSFVRQQGSDILVVNHKKELDLKESVEENQQSGDVLISTVHIPDNQGTAIVNENSISDNIGNDNSFSIHNGQNTGYPVSQAKENNTRSIMSIDDVENTSSPISDNYVDNTSNIRSSNNLDDASNITSGNNLNNTSDLMSNKSVGNSSNIRSSNNLDNTSNVMSNNSVGNTYNIMSSKSVENTSHIMSNNSVGITSDIVSNNSESNTIENDYNTSNTMLNNTVINTSNVLSSENNDNTSNPMSNNSVDKTSQPLSNANVDNTSNLKSNDNTDNTSNILSNDSIDNTSNGISRDKVDKTSNQKSNASVENISMSNKNVEKIIMRNGDVDGNTTVVESTKVDVISRQNESIPPSLQLIPTQNRVKRKMNVTGWVNRQHESDADSVVVSTDTCKGVDIDVSKSADQDMVVLLNEREYDRRLNDSVNIVTENLKPENNVESKTLKQGKRKVEVVPESKIDDTSNNIASQSSHSESASIHTSDRRNDKEESLQDPPEYFKNSLFKDTSNALPECVDKPLNGKDTSACSKDSRLSYGNAYTNESFDKFEKKTEAYNSSNIERAVRVSKRETVFAYKKTTALADNKICLRNGGKVNLQSGDKGIEKLKLNPHKSPVSEHKLQNEKKRKIRKQLMKKKSPYYVQQTFWEKK